MNLGPVFSVGVHILDILGRPVSEIPLGQRSLLLDEIKATAAGTAAGRVSTWPASACRCSAAAR